MDLPMVYAHIPAMRHLAAAIVLMLIAAPQPALADDAWAGQYRLAEGPDSVGELQLDPDGGFRFGMSAGALDTMAEGRWARSGDAITLRTEPRPVAPVFGLKSTKPGKSDGGFSILVTWPNGKGIAGVDFHIVFDDGADFTGYTQEYGWQSEPEHDRRIVSIQLAEPIHGTVSPVFDIPAGAQSFTFVLTPNDMGIADFDNAPAERSGDDLQLHWRGGVLRFVRRQ
jgi:hypothetical protein